MGGSSLSSSSPLAIVETYSKRLARLSADKPVSDLSYDDFPAGLRIQIGNILTKAIGPYCRYDPFEVESVPRNNDAWEFILETLSHELGVERLGGQHDNPYEQCIKFLKSSKVPQVLDFVEFALRIVETLSKTDRYELNRLGIEYGAKEAIVEINHRFQEHNVGYRFVNGFLFRVDSEFLHAEVLTVASSLLLDADFKGASNEFLEANEHYRHQRFKEAINSIGKAFESAMRCICQRHGWAVGENDTSKPLLDTMMNNGLVPKYIQNHFNGLRTTLEAGLPTIRNKSKASHGQGEKVVYAPEYLAAYALHLGAANILFLMRASSALLADANRS